MFLFTLEFTPVSSCSGYFFSFICLINLNSPPLASSILFAHRFHFCALKYRNISLLEAVIPWWRHQMETFSALLTLFARNSPVTGEFPAQRPVTRIFNVFLYLRLDKQLSKQSWGWWFETPSHPLWRHCDANMILSQVSPFHATTHCSCEVIGQYVDFSP